MKKIYVFLSFCLIHFITQAQTPQGIPYQSVIRNGSGALLINQAVHLRFSIHDSTMLGTIVYQESHTSTTTNLGMVILSIGQGTPSIGTFSAINWGSGAKFMQVELDTTGGSSYIDLGTQQMMSVPYALYAKTAGNVNLPPGASQGQVLTYCDGNYIWTNGGICPANVATIDCASATNMGVLNVNNPANNVSSTITYTGANGGAYSAQTISSAGVTGLTASLLAGFLNNGNGSLTFSISGTPSNSGTASFSFSIGDKSCVLYLSVVDTVTDIDGNVYNTIQIGNQIWMQSNLKVTKYRNGDSIPTGLNNSDWELTTSGAFDQQILAGSIEYFGRLYNHYAVSDNRGLCPSGWRVPSIQDWFLLSNYLGGELVSGGKLKSTITQPQSFGWLTPNTDATNSSGFSAYAAGFRNIYGNLGLEGAGTLYWSTSDFLGRVNASYVMSLFYSYGVFSIYDYTTYSENHNGFSVRCIKD